MYVVRAKTTDEGLVLLEIYQKIDTISKFDDDEEVQEPRAAEPHCQKVSNVKTTILDLTSLPQHLRTVDLNSQLFLTSKCTCGEQLGFTPHVARRNFGRLEQNRLRHNNPKTDSDLEGFLLEGDLEGNIGGSSWLPSSESPYLDAVIVERRWKGKDRVVGDCSCPNTRLSKLSVLENL